MRWTLPLLKINIVFYGEEPVVLDFSSLSTPVFFKDNLIVKFQFDSTICLLCMLCQTPTVQPLGKTNIHTATATDTHTHTFNVILLVLTAAKYFELVQS